MQWVGKMPMWSLTIFWRYTLQLLASNRAIIDWLTQICLKLCTLHLLQILGLEICADTMVGDEMLRGISGGQRKRVTTGKTVFHNHILGQQHWFCWSSFWIISFGCSLQVRCWWGQPGRFSWMRSQLGLIAPLHSKLWIHSGSPFTSLVAQLLSPYCSRHQRLITCSMISYSSQMVRLSTRAPEKKCLSFSSQ